MILRRLLGLFSCRILLYEPTFLHKISVTPIYTLLFVSLHVARQRGLFSQQKETYFHEKSSLGYQSRKLAFNYTLPVFPQGPILSDFGSKSDFLEQIGPRKVRFCTQKSNFEGLRQHQLVLSTVVQLRVITESVHIKIIRPTP